MSGAPKKNSSSSSSFPPSWLGMGLTQFPGISVRSSSTIAFHVSAVHGVCPTHFLGDLASAKVPLVLEKWGCPEGNTLTPLLALLTPWKAALVLTLLGNQGGEGCEDRGG